MSCLRAHIIPVNGLQAKIQPTCELPYLIVDGKEITNVFLAYDSDGTSEVEVASNMGWRIEGVSAPISVSTDFGKPGKTNVIISAPKQEGVDVSIPLVIVGNYAKEGARISVLVEGYREQMRVLDGEMIAFDGEPLLVVKNKFNKQ